MEQSKCGWERPAWAGGDVESMRGGQKKLGVTSGQSRNP